MVMALTCPAGDLRRVTILGATGSIGQSTLDLIGSAPERYEVVALTGQRNVERLAAAARRHRARLAVVGDPAAYASLKDALAGSGIEVAGGPQGLIEAAERPADWVMAAIVGAAGLEPTLAAVRRGAMVALATKEALICAGALLLEEVRASGAVLLPVDSEHNAIFQAVQGERHDSIERLFLTASGGPFRRHSLREMASATPSQAVAHPNWSMGAKISVDSATMMNKGLELIEAHHLFGLAADQIEILVHPESIVHSLVGFRDGSVLAQLGPPDMRIPIAYTLGWPDRIPAPTPASTWRDRSAQLRAAGPRAVSGARAGACGARARRHCADRAQRRQRGRRGAFLAAGSAFSTSRRSSRRRSPAASVASRKDYRIFLPSTPRRAARPTP